VPQTKVVTTDGAQEFANKMGIQFFETGSTNKNVEELLHAIARQVLIRMKKAEEDEKKNMCCRIIW
jgi:hypothetical protein